MDIELHEEVPVPKRHPTPVIVDVGAGTNHRTFVVDVDVAQRFDAVAVASEPAESPYLRGEATLRRFSDTRAWLRSQVRNAYLGSLRPFQSHRPIFDTRRVEPNNISHLLLDLIPHCLHVRRVVGPEVLPVFRPLFAPFDKLLEHFSIEPVAHRHRLVGRQVRIRGTRGLGAHEVLAEHDVSGIDLYADCYGTANQTPGTRRIFLSRRDGRSIRNIDAIRTIANDFRYEEIFMEDYPIPQQIEIGQSAEHVLAIHGAAMAYLVMAARLRSVIELFPSNVWHDHFPVRLGAKVDRYHQIVTEFDRRIMFSSWDTILRHKAAPFEVDPVALLRVLDEVHGSASARSQALQ